MLDNARRQVILVLLTIAGALLCSVLLKPGLGMDLKGGSQLIYEIPDEVLQKYVRDERTTVDDVMEHTLRIVRDRIDPTGVLDALVSRRGQNGILIELPYREKADLDEIKSRVSSLGKLEMRVVATDDYTKDGVTFDIAKEKQKLEAWLKAGGKELVLEKYQNIERYNDDPEAGPIARGNLKWFPHLVTPDLKNQKVWSGPLSFVQGGDGVEPLSAAVVAVFDRATDYGNGQLSEAQLKQERPFLLEYVAINMKERHFRGEDLDPAGVAPGFSDDGRPSVTYKLRDTVSGEYSDWSAKYIKKHSAIILNGVVRSAPHFEGRISGGRGEIRGGFSQEEVEELVKVLRTGALQVEPQMVRDTSVGPTLGQRSLDLGTYSLLAGTVAVFAFMLWFYKLAGIVACVTLVLNVFLLWACLLFMQATITLPGLGGIVLTMGMAVDANVLIYERIREEADRGKDMLRAVRAGFERAMSAILDSNITTFLTGIVLYNVGVGPVRGFAVTLMIGIVTTVFTQFFVTRLLFHFLLASGRLKDFKVRRLFAQPKFDYLRHARACVTGSIIVLTAGLIYAVAFVPTEVSLGIDFKGGANLQMLLQQKTDVAAVRSRLEGDAQFVADFRNFSVNTVDAEADDRSLFNVRLKLSDAMREQVEKERIEWRAEKKAREAEGKEPPPPYVAPYLAHLKRIFAAELAKPAYSDSKRVDGTTASEAFASINLHLQRPVELAKVQAQLQKAQLGSAQVMVPNDPSATQGTDLLVEWRTLPTTPVSTYFGTVREALAGLRDTTDKPISMSDPFPEAEEIQGRMVGELRNAAIGALILSWALIIFYLRVRFHEYKYGIAAVVSLMHDVLFAFVVVVIANHLGLVHAEINLNMIACFLTIIGYSVNDTIVIFDRIRENRSEDQKLGGHSTMRQIINLAVNQTMSRTVLTTGVTLFVVLAQFLVNWRTDSDLETFAFGMLVGMISGTYSTIFIAAPVLTWISDREAKKPPAPQPPVAAVPAQ